jgi:hypothetical protein
MLHSSRFLLLTIILTCFLPHYRTTQASASGFPNDTYVHYGKDGSTCNEHMDNNQAPPSNNQMVICKRQSGATTWWAEVYKADGTYVCGFSAQPATGSSKTFPCAITAAGYYRGYSHWLVNGSPQMNSTDQWFKK